MVIECLPCLLYHLQVDRPATSSCCCDCPSQVGLEAAAADDRTQSHKLHRTNAAMRIVVCGDDGATIDRVAIECVPCPYGGVRCYFLCPLIGVRCEQLFLADGIFASRNAHKLTYSSQSEDELSRARRKVRKLHRQVEGDFRYARPRGRNRWRIVQGLKAAKTEARALYHDRLRALVGDLP